MNLLNFKWPGRTILIVEDDPYNRQLIRFSLKKSEVKLLEAPNGELALDIINSEPDIDLVLMDIKLPGINGIDVTRAIREKGFDLPVFMVSSYLSDYRSSDVVMKLFDQQIGKPFRLSYLMEKIDLAFSKRSLVNLRSDRLVS